MQGTHNSPQIPHQAMENYTYGDSHLYMGDEAMSKKFCKDYPLF